MLAAHSLKRSRKKNVLRIWLNLRTDFDTTMYFDTFDGNGIVDEGETKAKENIFLSQMNETHFWFDEIKNPDYSQSHIIFAVQRNDCC